MASEKATAGCKLTTTVQGCFERQKESEQTVSLRTPFSRPRQASPLVGLIQQKRSSINFQAAVLASTSTYRYADPSSSPFCTISTCISLAVGRANVTDLIATSCKKNQTGLADYNNIHKLRGGPYC
ncbi:hypothetical protein BTUL_0196g00170 [Botrytis tulipae]|uniref:Uncharacterized protein n=1 Tax=Botrytis tulipae TaxID=87230 RepID=A0A4Z1ED75_9HELO|nr:hypothetical protein BTUL_0196g00170 [Botrytis tulipae]